MADINSPVSFRSDISHPTTILENKSSITQMYTYFLFSFSINVKPDFHHSLVKKSQVLSYLLKRFLIKNILLNNGYTIEVNPMTFQSDKVKIERITKIDQKKGDTISVDLLLVTPEIEKVWDSIQTLIWNGMELSIVSKQGLIDLKKLRNSKQDQADIEYLMKEL